jgi:hypothetical protein
MNVYRPLTYESSGAIQSTNVFNKSNLFSVVLNLFGKFIPNLRKCYAHCRLIFKIVFKKGHGTPVATVFAADFYVRNVPLRDHDLRGRSYLVLQICHSTSSCLNPLRIAPEIWYQEADK